MNKILGILMLLVYVCIASTLLNDAFVSSYNMQNIARWSALFGIIGIGVAFVIITGGIDLSIGSLIGLVGCLLPMLLVDYGWPIWLSLAIVMTVAVAIGLAHGLLVTKLKLQPFVVTLCGLLIYRGLARWITDDQTKGFGTQYNNTLRLIATGQPCSVALVLLVVGLALAGVFLWVSISNENDAERRRRFASNAYWVAFGFALAIIGSSRFWYGVEAVQWGEPFMSVAGIHLRTWGISVAAQGERLPGQLMQWFGWLFVPGGLWFLTVSLMTDWKKVVKPLSSMVTAAILLAMAISMVDWPDESFWPHAGWADRWRMTAVFISLALFMGSLAWFSRTSIRVGGQASRLPLLITASTAILWLAGKTSLGETLVPATFFVLCGLAAIAAVFLNQTIYGRYLLALGRNEEAARYSGINTDRMVILAYVICAGAAGIGGILFALDINSIQPSGHGNFYELYAIAAAVLGGCSLRGGEGSILGVVIGAAVMRVLYNSINLLGIPSQLEFAIIGFVILIGVVVDEIVRRVAARQRAAPEAVFAEEETVPRDL